MYHAELESLSQAALKKLTLQKRNLPGYLVHGALAGAYVGIGIVLIFLVGAPLAAANSPLTKVVMGLSFGIALTLVILAGSDLFTGNNLTMTVAALNRKINTADVLLNWGWTLLGNFLGSLLLAVVVVQAGIFDNPEAAGFVTSAAAKKMNLTFWQAFLRGALCNWLVCLAVWLSARLKSETAKIIMIVWCLFAFIASGFEHSIANLTLLSIALLIPHGAGVSLAGFFNNLIPVTLGNTLSGAIFVGAAYWFISQPQASSLETEAN